VLADDGARGEPIPRARGTEGNAALSARIEMLDRTTLISSEFQGQFATAQESRSRDFAAAQSAHLERSSDHGKSVNRACCPS